jgi:hypothetical protein
MQLCNLIIAEYTKSKLSDAKFAEFANEFLKNSKISYGHVHSRRTSLNIESNNVKSDPDSKLDARIAALEQKVNRLCEALGMN